MLLLSDPRTFVAIAFVIFFLIFGKKLWGALKSFLDNKTNVIRSDLEEAASLRSEAEEIMRKAKEERKKGEAEAAALIERSKAEAAYFEAETKKRLEIEAENYLKRSEVQIEAMRQSAKESLQQEVLAAAMKIAAEVIEKDLAENKEFRDSLAEKSFSRLSEVIPSV